MCELLHTSNHHYFDGNNKGPLYQCVQTPTAIRPPIPGGVMGSLQWAIAGESGTQSRIRVPNLRRGQESRRPPPDLPAAPTRRFLTSKIRKHAKIARQKINS